MPNLGPGVPNNLTPGITPTVVYTPTPNAAATCRISNNGGSTVWIGGANVSPFNGFPLPAGCRPVQLQNCPLTVYTCANVVAGAVTKIVGAAAPAALPAGTTSFTVTTAGMLTGPAILGFGGTGQEIVNVTSVTSTTVVTLVNATLYDHGASCTVSTATAYPSPITVTAGVV